ncbi:MAG: class I SAM-dependent methyltransferase [Bacteroidetes bacterium]|nr:MAG: class I SAM-dependent methyltransferase [Bacteroidota bacterium]
MRKWIFKAIIQKGISFLPFGHKLNFFFQKYVTRGVNLSDEYFEGRLIHAREHYKYFRKHSSADKFSHFEIGTGWYPVVPIGMFLLGADSITTIDLVRFANEDRFRTTVQKYVEYFKNRKLNSILPGILQGRLNVLLEEVESHSCNSLGSFLEKFRMEYHVADARKIPLNDNSFDLITSNNTFEHIYTDALEVILKEFRRLCKKGGVMSHSIDLSDHFQHMDSSITIYNFLKYSETQWRWINNSIQPMNRMRIYEYRELYRRLSITVTEEINREINMEDYNKVKVNERFSFHPAEENAVSHTQLVSVM